MNLGQCQNDPATYCLPIGSQCVGNKGACVQVQNSFCLNQDSCDLADYATPAVEIATLPGAAPALLASIQGEAPEGATPTAPALAGALSHAASWAGQNPTHKVVAVLATDGLPTECAPTDIDSIAQLAADGLAASPSVPTFVIGVFAGNDQVAKQNMNQLAAAGGTGQAFFISNNVDVAQAFLDALKAIQGTALACEYQLPAPPSGSELDFGKVNVQHTPPMGSMPNTIPYVANQASCDPVAGGWYYDVDPASGGTPTSIVMCPATCDLFGQGGTVQIALGCETVIAVPN